MNDALIGMITKSLLTQHDCEDCEKLKEAKAFAREGQEG